MYETLKSKFPHLSDEDRLNIALFIHEYTWNEIQRVYREVWEIFNKNL